MPPPSTLRALGWDHERCSGPMLACARRWSELGRGTVEWTFRTLEEFGDAPLEEAVAGYDLAVIDHPFCGVAERTGCLLPLDDLLPAGLLADLAAGSIGGSHASYSYAGGQWALATDAASQVSALRPGVHTGDPPATWDEVLELARSLPGQVAMPLSPAHAISSYLTLCAGLGAPGVSGDAVLADVYVTGRALDLLGELHALGPAEATGWEPPDVLARLTATDGLAYVPLTYGYVTYARAGVPARCRFADVPGARGAVLGGAGIAVGATTAEPERAAAFAAWVAGDDVQRELVAPAGGQPAARAAWVDPQIDAVAGGFYSATRATLEGAWTRPREPWWPGFQLGAGKLLTRALDEHRPQSTTRAELQALHDYHLRRAA